MIHKSLIIYSALNRIVRTLSMILFNVFNLQINNSPPSKKSDPRGGVFPAMGGSGVDRPSVKKFPEISTLHIATYDYRHDLNRTRWMLDLIRCSLDQAQEVESGVWVPNHITSRFVDEYCRTRDILAGQRKNG